MREDQADCEAPEFLRLKAAEFLGIAVKTRDPDLAAEARAIALRCIRRAIEPEAPAPRRAASPLRSDAIPAQIRVAQTRL